MATLSTKFHDVSGHLTKIAVTALGAKDEIQDLDVSKMTSQEMAELVKKMCVVFGKVAYLTRVSYIMLCILDIIL